MPWNKREANAGMLILGDGEKNVKKVDGLLLGDVQDGKFKHANFKVLVPANGGRSAEEVIVAGNAAILARITVPGDIGKYVRIRFNGWKDSPNGKAKDIDVQFLETESGEPEDPDEKVAKYCPEIFERYKQIKAARAQGKLQSPEGKPPEDYSDFPEALEEDEDDGLPF